MQLGRVTILLTVLALTGCGGGGPAAPPRTAPRIGPIDPGATVGEVMVTNPQVFWTESDFVELVPVVDLPSAHAGDRVRTMLRVPHDAYIGARWQADEERWVPVYPPGTRAERVAYVAGDTQGTWTVLDARGGEVRPDGQQVRVLRALHSEPFAPLIGLTWRRGDVRARTEAYARLERLMAQVPAPFRTRPLDARAIEQLRPLNECPACHVDQDEIRIDAGRVPPWVRETDAAGWFTPLAVLATETPVEDAQTAARIESATVEVRCPDGRPPARTSPMCADGAVPVARTDIARALAAGHPRAQRICQSRRFLFDRFDAQAREAFAQAFTDCGITAPPAPPTPAPVTASPVETPEPATPARPTRPRRR